MSRALAQVWARPLRPVPDAEIRLFCLPYAGSGASAFRQWVPELQERMSIEVIPVQLPGRESRIREAPTIDVEEMARAVHTQVDRPYAILGHSLGGRLAFELSRKLREYCAPPPRRLYVLGCPAPHIVRNRHDSDLSDEELIGRIVRMGGTPREIFADSELRELVLPVIRSDFAWVDNYRCQPKQQLAVPIRAFVGSDDEEATPDDAAAWAAHTSSEFSLHVMDGGHFFLHEHRAEIAAHIIADLGEAR